MRAWTGTLAIALCAALSTPAFAQQRFGPRRNGPANYPGPLHMPRLVHRPVAPAPVANPNAPQPAVTQGCAHGPCSGTAQVIPARTSATLVQQTPPGATPASLSAQGDPGAAQLAGPPGGQNVLLQPPGAPLPAPRQPLSDVLAPNATVRITIRAISAARSGELQPLEIDGRLAPIDKDLRSFADQFSYRNYRLLDVQTFDLDFRSIAQMELPGQRAIEVEPRLLGADGRVKVHLELLGQHPEHTPRMRADYSIPRGRTILVGGYRIDPNAPERGTLLLAITQDE